MAQAVEVIPPQGNPIRSERAGPMQPEVWTEQPNIVDEYPIESSIPTICDCNGGCDACCGAESVAGYPMACDQYPAYPAAAQGSGWDPECPPLIYIDWRRFDVFGGVHGFTGPANYAGANANLAARDGSGSFGFHEGFNYGRNLPWLLSGQMSGQLGLRATQSNLTGAEFTDSTRSQLFLTGGIFRRSDFGLQGGVVMDYLHDDWYAQFDLTQIRGELSWVTRGSGEFGYRTALGTNKSNSTGTINDHINAVANIALTGGGIDQHRLFYRHHFGPVGTGEISGGFTNNSDALFGGDIRIPLTRSLGLATGFTMMYPNGQTEALDQQRESWNVFMSFEWRPIGNRQCRDYHLPLFPVADNGSFFFDVTQ